MVWTTTNLVIQIIAGILGGNVAALASKEHSFGALWPYHHRRGGRCG